MRRPAERLAALSAPTSDDHSRSVADANRGAVSDVLRRSRTSHVGEYFSLELQKPERVLLERFKSHWANMSMLDVGVGAGRTAYTFAAITKRYVGIDFVPEMIERSRRLIGEGGTTSFVVCDARRMAHMLDERFDLVLFSYNGIDLAGHEERLRILRETRRLLEPDGYFFFSSHSLASLPFRADPPRMTWRDPWSSAYELTRYVYRSTRFRTINAAAREVEGRGWAQLRDGTYRFKLLLYYVRPDHQVVQLREAGFRVVEAYDLDGVAVDPKEPGTDPWLYYLCQAEA